LHWHTCANKYWSAAENVRITVNDLGPFCHGIHRWPIIMLSTAFQCADNRLPPSQSAYGNIPGLIEGVSELLLRPAALLGWLAQ
jgi:hypothetical protein